MEKLVVGLLKATRILTLIASVNLNHQEFLGPLGSPQKIVVVPHPSLYRSEGNRPITIRARYQIIESPRQSSPSFLHTPRVRISS